jgi:hypothetical protein
VATSALSASGFTGHSVMRERAVVESAEEVVDDPVGDLFGRHGFVSAATAASYQAASAFSLASTPAS